MNAKLSARVRKIMHWHKEYAPRQRDPREALPDRTDRMKLPVYVPSRDNPDNRRVR